MEIVMGIIGRAPWTLAAVIPAFVFVVIFVKIIKGGRKNARRK